MVFPVSLPPSSSSTHTHIHTHHAYFAAFAPQFIKLGRRLSTRESSLSSFLSLSSRLSLEMLSMDRQRSSLSDFFPGCCGCAAAVVVAVVDDEDEDGSESKEKSPPNDRLLALDREGTCEKAIKGDTHSALLVLLANAL